MVLACGSKESNFHPVCSATTIPCCGLAYCCSSLFSAGPDELPDHGLDADEGLLADGLDPTGGQQEAEAARVRQLDGVRVRDAQRALRPVVAAAWKGGGLIQEMAQPLQYCRNNLTALDRGRLVSTSSISLVYPSLSPFSI